MKSIFISLFAFFALSTYAQTVTLVPGMNKTAIKYIKGSNSTTPCIIWAPDDWDPNSNKKYPLIIAYHGAEAAILPTGVTTAQDVTVLLGNGILVNLSHGQKAQTMFGGQLIRFIVVAPQASSYTADTSWLNPNINDITKRLLIGTAGNVKIDSSRIYLTSYSAGGKPAIGNTILSTADSIYSKMIAASIPMSPATQDVNFPKLKLAAIRGIHFLSLTGALDPSYVAQMNRVRDTIQKYNNTLFPIADVMAGNAHCCWEQYWDTAFSVPGFGKNIFQWLLLWQKGFSNSPPTLNAGINQNIILPAGVISLSGSAIPGTSKIISTAWSQLSGPNNATINAPASLSTAISNLVKGVYVFQLAATDSLGLTAAAATQITVQVASPPTVSAGGNPTIVLPANSISLIGSATKGTGGPVLNTVWSQRSGPSNAGIASPNTLTTLVSGLVSGTYVFRLSVTDSVGNGASDSAIVTVYAANGYSINVRLFAGTAPFQNPLWNNWNVGTGAITNASSGVLKYSDGSSSSISAVLSYQDNIGDNGTGYTTGAAICPDSVLRFTSYSTSTRTLTVNGLNNSNQYNLEFYASRGRTDGQKTTFTIGSQSFTVLTDNNSTNAAKFSGISPSSGKIVVNINRAGSTYSYLNGFKISVNVVNNGPTVSAGSNQTIILPLDSLLLNGTVTKGSSGIASIAWTQVSGPSTAGFRNVSAPATITNHLIAGTYLFKLTALDSLGASSAATVQVIVIPQPVPPVVNAGNNQSITLPINMVNLAGSAVAGSSRILSTSWSQVGTNPGTATINSPASLSTLVKNLVQGTYQFKLLALDSMGQSSSSIVQVFVLPAVSPPVVNAGNSQTISFPANAVLLNATMTPGSSPVISSVWTQLSGPTTATLSNPDSLITQAGGLSAGTYNFQLSVTDSLGFNVHSTVQVIVQAAAGPQANAGSGQTIQYPANTLTLNGSVQPGSSPVTSKVWTQTGGPVSVTMLTPDSLTTQVSGLVEGSFSFQLSVTDSFGLNALSAVQVNVEPALPPQANSGNAQTIRFPVNSILLNGMASPGSSPVTKKVWTQTGGPVSATILSPDSLITQVSGLVEGSFSFQLSVTDSLGLNGLSAVQIIVEPALPPLANAGNTQTIRFPVNSILVTGMASPGSSPVMSKVWTQTAGPVEAVIATADSLSTALTGLVEGSFTFQLSVTDSLGLNAVSTVLVLVQAPLPPQASAGSSQIARFPANAVMLNGTINPGSSPVLYKTWTQISGPSTAIIANPDSLISMLAGLAEGNYLFQLSVTDSLGLTAASQVQVTVEPPLGPLVNAGTNQSITFPANSVILNGTATAGSSSLVSVSWTQSAGPVPDDLINPDQLNAQATNLLPGNYTFKLSALDSLGLTDSALVQVLVNPAVLPKANAGGNKTISLPTNSLTLNGLATAGSSKILSTVWSQISGPGIATITPASSPTTTASGLIKGTYLFRLTVTDSLGNFGTDSATITVNAAPPSTVNVRLYAGTAPFLNTAWNNWNVGTGVKTNAASGVLKYAGGTNSPFTAVLSYQDQLGDNGVPYLPGSSMCPDSVLRFMSYTTSTRTLTISGLNNTLKYDLEFYASRGRTDGQITLFTIGSKTISVSTDNNGSLPAKFQAIAPSGGKIVVSMARGSVYSYLNGFKITELAAGGGGSTDEISARGIIQSGFNTDSSALNIKLFPNPATDFINILSTGQNEFVINIWDMSGRKMIEEKVISGSQLIKISALAAGLYTVVGTDSHGKFLFSRKIIKN